MGDRHAIQEHKLFMEAHPDAPHEDDHTLVPKPGESGEIVWTFTEAGSFEFACLKPGHYDLGMFGPLIVAGR